MLQRRILRTKQQNETTESPHIMTEKTESPSPEKEAALFPKPKPLSYLFIFLLLLGSFGLDQMTKIVAEKNLMVWESADSISHYEGRRDPLYTLGTKDYAQPEKDFYVSFAFNYVRNQGAAWGLFSDLNENVRTPLFHLITIFATLFIFLYWRSTPAYCRLTRFSLALVFSGALGNFSDRFLRGFVVDFLDVSWSIPLPFKLNFSIDIFPKFLDFLNLSMNTSRWAYDFPKFNWADSCITVGVTLLMIDMLFFENARNQKLQKLEKTTES